MSSLPAMSSPDTLPAMLSNVFVALGQPASTRIIIAKGNAGRAVVDRRRGVTGRRRRRRRRRRWRRLDERGQPRLEWLQPLQDALPLGLGMHGYSISRYRVFSTKFYAVLPGLRRLVPNAPFIVWFSPGLVGAKLNRVWFGKRLNL